MEVGNLLGVDRNVWEGAGSEAPSTADGDGKQLVRHLPEEVKQVLKTINARLEKLIQEKEDAVATQDFEKAAWLRDKEDKLKGQLVDGFKKIQALLRQAEDESP